jgi:hypothetical protein
MRCTKGVILTEQLELLERPPVLTRAAARRVAMEAAHARAELGADRAAHSANSVCPGWLDLVLDRVRAFAATNPGIFSIEMMRGVIGTEVPQPPDLRAWGRVTQDAIRLGYIERVPKVVIPAASSNGSVKPAWRKGPKA